MNKLMFFFSIFIATSVFAADNLPRRLYSEQEIFDRQKENYRENVERKRLAELRTCRATVEKALEQRRANLPTDEFLRNRDILHANLPAYAWDAEIIQFRYEIPGLKFEFKQGAYTGGFRTQELKDLRISYDPRYFSRLSVIRHMFGSKPLEVTRANVRDVGQSHFLSDSGVQAEIYLKGSNSTDDLSRDDGGLLMISRDTGQVRFWAPGTDVDGDLSGALAGSLSAIGRFGRGLFDEAQMELRKFTGTWVKDPHIIDAQAVEILPREP